MDRARLAAEHQHCALEPRADSLRLGHALVAQRRDRLQLLQHQVKVGLHAVEPTLSIFEAVTGLLIFGALVAKFVISSGR